MSFKTAQDAFESAQQIADANNDSAAAQIAVGMVELTKAIRAEMRSIGQKVDSVESKVRNLR